MRKKLANREKRKKCKKNKRIQWLIIFSAALEREANQAEERRNQELKRQADEGKVAVYITFINQLAARKAEEELKEAQRQKEEDEERFLQAKRIEEERKRASSPRLEESASAMNISSTPIDPSMRSLSLSQSDSSIYNDKSSVDPSSINADNVRKLSATDKAVLREKALERISKIKERLRSTN